MSSGRKIFFVARGRTACRPFAGWKKAFYSCKIFLCHLQNSVYFFARCPYIGMYKTRPAAGYPGFPGDPAAAPRAKRRESGRNANAYPNDTPSGAVLGGAAGDRRSVCRSVLLRARPARPRAGGRAKKRPGGKTAGGPRRTFPGHLKTRCTHRTGCMYRIRRETSSRKFFKKNDPRRAETRCAASFYCQTAKDGARKDAPPDRGRILTGSLFGRPVLRTAGGRLLRRAAARMHERREYQCYG